MLEIKTYKKSCIQCLNNGNAFAKVLYVHTWQALLQNAIKAIDNAICINPFKIDLSDFKVVSGQFG